MKQMFAKEVDAGLSAEPKKLPSKYFYDAKGDELFVEIMNAPEYYLTDCEMQIFKQRTDDLIRLLAFDQPFELIELGAGDGTKTIHLLKALHASHSFRYCPIDISQHALDELKAFVEGEIENIEVFPIQGDYFAALDKLEKNNTPRVMLFLGSNLGNMSDADARKFLKRLSAAMQQDDRLLLGVDLKKNPDIILPAYDDSAGVTSEFNLNLLRRINRELGANFDLEAFEHAPLYDPVKGEARSYLVSLKAQEVYIEAIDRIVHFDEGEKIHTETSKKYDIESVKRITAEYGLEYIEQIQDERCYFSDVILRKTQTP